MRALVYTMIGLSVVGCGSAKNTTEDSSGPWTKDTADTDLTDTDPPDSGDSGDSGTPDANLIFAGSASLDLVNGLWVGSESAQYFTDLGTLVCQWTWQAQDWEHDPAVMAGPNPRAMACTDDDGNPCDFSFSVNLTSGFATSGNCDAYAATGDIEIAGGDYGYGYITNYYSGTTPYGEQFMYHALDQTGLETWIAAPKTAVDGSASWEQLNGDFDYELTKALIQAYAL